MAKKSSGLECSQKYTDAHVYEYEGGTDTKTQGHMLAHAQAHKHCDTTDGRTHAMHGRTPRTDESHACHARHARPHTRAVCTHRGSQGGSGTAPSLRGRPAPVCACVCACVYACVRACSCMHAVALVSICSDTVACHQRYTIHCSTVRADSQ